MKYYGGMTFKEIAASLDIPYETAKKRHQRSLKKLRKSMIIGMVVILLAALLAACAYVVLRYFGVVPGYGVPAVRHLLRGPRSAAGQFPVPLQRQPVSDGGQIALQAALVRGKTLPVGIKLQEGLVDAVLDILRLTQTPGGHRP